MAYPNYFNGYYGAVPDMLGQFKGQYQQPMMQPTQQSDPLLWVLNENEATSYPVAPNNSVVLWDKNKPTIYVKMVNAQGIPSMRILDFVERTENSTKEAVAFDDSKYVTIEQFNALKSEFEALASKYEQSNKTKKAKESE
jgi:hypothetical protein